MIIVTRFVFTDFVWPPHLTERNNAATMVFCVRFSRITTFTVPTGDMMLIQFQVGNFRSFKDVATLVYYLKAVPWTVPEFSATKYRSHLEKLQQRLEIDGELIFNLSGTQFILRTGDKLEMPSNTLYSYSNLKNESCYFLSAKTI